MVTRLKARKRSDSMRRRHFFRSFLGEAVSAVDEIRGRPQLSIDDIGRLPDSVLRTMRPVRDALGPYLIEQGQLLRGEPGDPARRQIVYVFESWELDVLARFDGRSTLDAIAQAHATSHKIDVETAYKRAKSLFVALASYLVCRPADAHERVKPPS